MKFRRKEYRTRREKQIDFLVGLGGWFIINGMLSVSIPVVALLLSTIVGGVMPADVDVTTRDTLLGASLCLIGGLPLLINAVTLIFLGIMRPWMALGALTALGIAVIVVLMLTILTLGACFAMSNPISTLRRIL